MGACNSRGPVERDLDPIPPSDPSPPASTSPPPSVPLEPYVPRNRVEYIEPDEPPEDEQALEGKPTKVIIRIHDEDNLRQSVMGMLPNGALPRSSSAESPGSPGSPNNGPSSPAVIVVHPDEIFSDGMHNPVLSPDGSHPRLTYISDLQAHHRAHTQPRMPILVNGVVKVRPDLPDSIQFHTTEPLMLRPFNESNEEEDDEYHIPSRLSQQMVGLEDTNGIIDSASKSSLMLISTDDNRRNSSKTRFSI
jgi:hypothetical protein